MPVALVTAPDDGTPLKAAGLWPAVSQTLDLERPEQGKPLPRGYNAVSYHCRMM